MLLLMKFHILRKLIKMKELVHSGHIDKIINGSKYPFPSHFSNLRPNPYLNFFGFFDVFMFVSF